MSVNRHTQSDTQPDNLTVKAKPLSLLVRPAVLTQTGDSEVGGGWLFKIHGGEGTASV